MSQDQQYDDGARLCPHCRQWKQFEFSLGYYHCSFCTRDITVQEFEASRDSNKLPLVGKVAPEGQAGSAGPMPRRGNGEGMPEPDVHPLKDEWGDIPEGVPDNL